MWKQWRAGLVNSGDKAESYQRMTDSEAQKFENTKYVWGAESSSFSVEMWCVAEDWKRELEK